MKRGIYCKTPITNDLQRNWMLLYFSLFKEKLTSALHSAQHTKCPYDLHWKNQGWQVLLLNCVMRQIVQLLEEYIPPDGSIYGCWQIIAGSSGLDGLKHDNLMLLLHWPEIMTTMATMITMRMSKIKQFWWPHFPLLITCTKFCLPSFNPFTCKISLVILLTVCHTTLMMSVWKTWYWIN